MKLIEFLKVIGREEYIGIWNVDKVNDNRPTQQHYAKVKNLTYGNISNLLDYDVLGVNHTEKGYLVRVYRRDRVDRDLNAWGLVDKYFHRLEQRNGVK